MQNEPIESKSIKKVYNIPPIPEGWISIEIPKLNKINFSYKEVGRYYSKDFSEYYSKMENSINITSNEMILKFSKEDSDFFQNIYNKKCIILIEE